MSKKNETILWDVLEKGEAINLRHFKKEKCDYYSSEQNFEHPQKLHLVIIKKILIYT